MRPSALAGITPSWLIRSGHPAHTHTHLGSFCNGLCRPPVGRHELQGCCQDAVLQLLLTLIILLLLPALVGVPETDRGTESSLLLSPPPAERHKMCLARSHRHCASSQRVSGGHLLTCQYQCVNADRAKITSSFTSQRVTERKEPVSKEVTR